MKQVLHNAKNTADLLNSWHSFITIRIGKLKHAPFCFKLSHAVLLVKHVNIKPLEDRINKFQLMLQDFKIIKYQSNNCLTLLYQDSLKSIHKVHSTTDDLTCRALTQNPLCLPHVLTSQLLHPIVLLIPNIQYSLLHLLGITMKQKKYIWKNTSRPNLHKSA